MSAAGQLPKRVKSRRYAGLWSRNPLLGRGEACHRLFLGLLVTAVCALPAVAFLLGRLQCSASEEERHSQLASRHSVQATLLQNVYSGASSWRGSDGRVSARVSWTAADGTVRTGKAPVEPPGRTGEPTTIWLDTTGTPVESPATESKPYRDAAGTAVVVLLGGLGLVMAAYSIEHSLFMRSRMRAWAREWAEVAPLWTANA